MLKRMFTLAAMCGLIAAGPAQAEDVAEFFKGKTVKFIVGYNPGGGYDVYARVVAQHYGRHIPGKPNMIVQNMPGAGSLKAANYLWAVAPKDGTEIGMVSRNMPLLGILGDKNAKFEAEKFGWLGSPTDGSDDAYILWYRTDSGVKSIQDAIKPGGATLILGGTRPGSTGADVPKILQDAAGVRVKQILGFRGSDDIFLAVDRKEIMGRTADLSAITSSKAEWMDRKNMIPLVQFARTTRHPKFPDVPTAREIAKDKAALALIKATEAPFKFARPVLAPPQLPPARLAALRKAFMDVHKDPEYVAYANKQKVVLSPISGEDVLKEILEIKNETPQPQ
ncbi:MAG: hypothetical protein RLZ98_2410, partial [Pseudomonadota bacterium]